MDKRPILIIDDDHKVCELVTAILKGSGFHVVAALDGPSGIETAREVQPAVILLDMMMPDVDGIETCNQLKKDPILKDIPVVGITASPDLTYSVKAFRAGAHLFLPKPVGARSLLHVVELAIDAAETQARLPRRQRPPRFSVTIPIRCLLGGEAQRTRELVGQTVNASVSGLMLLLPETLASGMLCRLWLGLPGGPTSADGAVVWQNARSVEDGQIRHGIRFVGFPEESGLVQYRRFLNRLAGADATTMSP